MNNQTSKTVIVTGGTRGIGADIVRAFIADGATVFVGARTETSFIRELGPKAHFVKMDVSQQADHRRIVEIAIEKTGQLDVYVNNAGVSQWRPVEDIDAAFWKMMIDVNLSGVFWGAQAAAAAMKSGGTILNISSLAGKRGSANNSAYCAAKFGVNGLTQSFAKEFGARGLRVNAVCPVYVMTETIVESLKDPRSPAGEQSVDAYLAQFASSQTALKRLPTGGEVASTCVFLASKAASAITGQCLNVDCGVMPQ
jgi:NAD(P)-dependent dehydrogenase (short-subunit alcohol dehydrogenase family)